LILLKNPYFRGRRLAGRAAGGAVTRNSRNSRRLTSCHRTASPASNSNAAASGSGMLT
jgi:hypothetical protein